MKNQPIFSQMLALMWEASQWVLNPKFLVVLYLQAFKVWKKSVLVRKNENQNFDSSNFQSHCKILEPKLIEKLSTLIQAFERKLVDF